MNIFSSAETRLFRLTARVAIASLAVALTSGANASPITFYFGGVFTAAGGGGRFLAGQDFSGQFTYDPSSSPSVVGTNFKNYTANAGDLRFASGSTSASLGRAKLSSVSSVRIPESSHQ